MSIKTLLKLSLAAFLVIVRANVSLAAKPKAAGTGQAVVDVVTQKSGRALRGVVAWQEPNGAIKMIVSTDWYRESNPGKIDATLAQTSEQRRLAWTQATQRISERLKSAPISPQFEFFLQQESDRIQRLLAERNPADPDFLWIDVPQQTIGKVARATPEQRNVGLFAWNEQLAKVETRDRASLTKELSDKAVDINGLTPDLSGRLPALPQDEREWSARMALVEYSLTAPLDFQGMGDAIVRTETGQKIDLAAVLPKVFEQQLSSLLKDLSLDNRSPDTRSQLNNESLKAAIREAESAKARGFRVTRLLIDAASTRVSVETRFVAKVGTDNWQTAWQTATTEDGTQVRPELEQRIEQDPQVKSMNDVIKSIGVVDPNAMQRAIRFGAATMSAQQNVDAKFSEFRDRYSRRLDGPPLVLPVGQ